MYRTPLPAPLRLVLAPIRIGRQARLACRQGSAVRPLGAQAIVLFDPSTPMANKFVGINRLKICSTKALRRARQRAWTGALVLAAACLTGCASGTPDSPGVRAPVAERVQAQLDLARGYLERKDFTRAREPLQRALSLNPDEVEAHVLAGVLHEREQEVELAERHYQTALKIDPTDPQALNNYGAFLYGQGRLQAALDPLRRAVQDAGYRQRAQAYENLGFAELGLGRIGSARFAFERALELGGSQPRSSLELAAILYSQQNYGGAESRYHEFLEYAGDTTRSRCLGLKLGSVQGATQKSMHHAAWLQRKFPEAMQQCR